MEEWAEGAVVRWAFCVGRSVEKARRGIDFSPRFIEGRSQGFGKQLICRRKGPLALVLLGPESADQGSGPRPSLSLGGPSQQALSPQGIPSWIVGSTRRRALRLFSLPGVSPARSGTRSFSGLRSAIRWSFTP
jgi:hypothetical protein